MRTDTIFEKLKVLKNTYNVLSQDADFNALYSEIKNEVELETVSSPSEKNQIKAIQKFIKKCNKDSREILHKACVKNIDGVDCQVITDSFSMFYFNNKLPIDTWEEEEKISEYPNVSSFIREIKNHNGCEIVNINYENLVKNIKLHKMPREILCGEINECRFDTAKVKEALDIMGDKATIYLAKKTAQNGSPFGFLYLLSDNGGALVLGMRKYEDENNSAENIIAL